MALYKVPFTLLGVFLCLAVSDAKRRIIGGHQANPDVAKFVCNEFCTCVLVSDRVVLTAVHCFDWKRNKTEYNATVHINQFNMSQPTENSIKVDGVGHILEEYLNPNVHAPYLDFAIIILNEPIKVCEDENSPIPMPMPFKFELDSNDDLKILHSTYTDDQLEGVFCRNYGFGDILPGEPWKGSDVIKYGDFKFNHVDDDSLSLSSIECDGYVGMGDSGGPSFCKINGRYQLTDVCSLLVGSEPQEVYNSDIRKYGDFILKVMNEAKIGESYLKTEEKCTLFVDRFEFEQSTCT